MVDISGRMEEFMKATGLITKCMVKENTNGKMAVVIKANTSTIKNTVSGSTPGLMGEDTRDHGKMVNDKVKVNISYHLGLADRASGIKTKESDG